MMQSILVFIIFILHLKANPIKASFIEASFNATLGDHPLIEPRDASLLVKVNGRSRTAITIRTPKFDKPYPRRTQLIWDIETSGRVEIFCPVFKLRPRRKGRCTDYVSIEDGGENKRYCGKELNGMSYKSTSNQILLKFKSSKKPNNDYIGFTCTISRRRPTFNCSQDTLPVVNTRIIGGVRPFPWQATLVSPGTNNLICGGSVIGSRWILTAAHCIKTNGVVLPLDELQILVGIQCLSQPNAGTGRVNPINIIPHPDYNGVTLYNDIALIQLGVDLNFEGSEIRPVLIPNVEDPFVGEDAIISGHGRTTQDGPTTDCLRNAIVPTINNFVCNLVYAPRGYTVIPEQICASYPLGGVGPCQGDSGGAMVIFSNDLVNYIQIGIVSLAWDGTCAEPGVPTIYTRTSSYYNWIFTTTGTGSLACA